jgi:hypothetical protein
MIYSFSHINEGGHDETDKIGEPFGPGRAEEENEGVERSGTISTMAVYLLYQ